MIPVVVVCAHRKHNIVSVRAIRHANTEQTLSRLTAAVSVNFSKNYRFMLLMAVQVVLIHYFHHPFILFLHGILNVLKVFNLVHSAVNSVESLLLNFALVSLIFIFKHVYRASAKTVKSEDQICGRVWR